MKAFLKDSFKIFTGGATVITYYTFHKTLNDDSLRTQLDSATSQQEALRKEVSDNEMNELANEIIKVKLEALKGQLNPHIENVQAIAEKIKGLNPEDTSSMKYYVESLIKNINDSNLIINQIVDLFKPKGTGTNLVDPLGSIIKLINNYTEMISQLNITELGALTHILSSLFILLCLLTIMAIVYSNFLLTYFKIEEKYPKLGRFLKIKKMFQQYYLFINLTSIIITLLAIIYINILIILKY